MDRRSSQFTRFLFLALSLAIVVTVVGTSHADDKEQKSSETYLLRHKFEKGQIGQFKVTDKQNINSQMNGLKEKVLSETRTQRSYRVVSVDDEGNAELELTIEKVWMKNQFNEADPVVFDSEDATKQPEQFAKIMETVGKPMSQVKVSPLGKMLKATRIGAKTEISVEDAQNLNFLVVLPEEEISTGSEWSEDIFVEVAVDRSLKKKIKLRRKYKLESVDKDIAKISLHTVILTPIRNPAVKGRTLALKPDGLLEFDINNGQLISRKLKVRDQTIGAFGPKSLMQMATERTEKLIPLATQTATKPADSSTK